MLSSPDPNSPAHFEGSKDKKLDSQPITSISHMCKTTPNIGSLKEPLLGSPLGSPSRSQPKAPTYNQLPQTIRKLEQQDLVDILSQQSVIIDVRPFHAYSTSRIKNAIHLAVPSTLVKRQSYSLNCIINSIPVESHQKNLLAEYLEESDGKRPLKVVVYDSESSSTHCSALLYHIFGKFSHFNCHHGGFDVFCLEGGFSSIQSPSVIDSSPLSTLATSPDSSSSGPPKLAKPSLFGGFTLPSATPSNQTFLRSIGGNSPRVNENLSTFNYCFNVPQGLDKKVDQLPKWLQFLVTTKEAGIVDVLTHRFNKIEKSEQTRLKTAIGSVKETQHVPLVCTPSALCPACDTIDYELPKGIENGYKNRYKNIWPYEHSRVKVGTQQDDDYINANYISYEDLSDLSYIATQNPLQATYEDFWNLIQCNKINVIVCLNKQRPAELVGQDTKYFDSQEFPTSQMEVKKVSVEDHGDFVVRHMQLLKEAHPMQKVYQIEYKSWPDFGVPDSFSGITDLLNYKNKLIENEDLNKQIVVHCSAGCGRTGCFITTDMVLDRLRTQASGKDDGKVDVWGSDDVIYKSVQLQRTQRVSMVQNLRQFIVCYEIVLNYFAENYV